MLKEIRMYRAVSKLQKRILMEYPETWDQEDFEARLKALEDWNLLRELEEIGLNDKAKAFNFVINTTILWSALAGTLMIVMILLSSNGGDYYSAMIAFEAQMLIMLMLHIVFVFWRWLWSRKLDKLGLSIPITDRR